MAGHRHWNEAKELLLALPGCLYVVLPPVGSQGRMLHCEDYRRQDDLPGVIVVWSPSVEAQLAVHARTNRARANGCSPSVYGLNSFQGFGQRNMRLQFHNPRRTLRRLAPFLGNEQGCSQLLQGLEHACRRACRQRSLYAESNARRPNRSIYPSSRRRFPEQA